MNMLFISGQPRRGTISAFKKMLKIIQQFNYVPSLPLASDLRARGITIPVTDILIAHLAKANHLEMVSLDLHFDQVPGLKRRKPGG